MKQRGNGTDAVPPFFMGARYVGAGRTVRRLQAGFTLTELVAVILIMGILSVGAVSLFDRRTFDTAGFADQAQNAFAYAQKVAVAQRRPVQVALTASTISLIVCTVSDCSATTPVPAVLGSGNFISAAPSGVTLSTTPSVSTLTFDALGRASTGIVVTISGSGSRSFTVEQETGYVHP
jgi:MSHA pilin protein MshC